MSGPDKFIDTLLTLPTALLNLTYSTVSSLESSIDDLASSLRHAVGRDPPPPPPPPMRIPGLPKGVSQRTVDWVLENRAVVAGVCAFLGTGTVLYWRRRRGYLAKRRAGRGRGGGRRAVVVVFGNLSEPITRSVVLDLERRLFSVHVIAGSEREQEMVRQQGKRDIEPMLSDFTDPFEIEQTLETFSQPLNDFTKDLHLAGLVVVPDTNYVSGPAQTLSPEIWADTFNTRLVQTIATVHAFIPLLIEQRSRLVMVTPTITSSMALPYRGPENATISALEGFTNTLDVEMRRFGAGVCNIRLGNFNLEGQDKTSLVRNASSEVLGWPQDIKERYGESYMRFADSASSSARGSPLRELHNTIFDVLTKERRPGSTLSVGRGSRLYPLIGRWAPYGLVPWMMGLR